MMKPSFDRAVDSLFQRLGQKATYLSQTHQYPILVLARCPEHLFELGERELHAEHPQLTMRVSEGVKPRRHAHLLIDERAYIITTEPQLDLHHLLWFLDCLRQDERTC